MKGQRNVMFPQTVYSWGQRGREFEEPWAGGAQEGVPLRSK